MHKIMADAPGWQTVRVEEKYEDAWTRLCVEHVRRPSSSEPQAWTVVHRRAAAVIAPFTPEGHLVMVRQERIPIRAAIWEFPAGQIDEEHEQDDAVVRETALRELHEESGYGPGPEFEMIPRGIFFSSPGFTDEHAYFFEARNVVPLGGRAEPDGGESILEVGVFTASEFRAMVHEGTIRDANTLALFARMCAAGSM